jgi:hypothetical protein
MRLRFSSLFIPISIATLILSLAEPLNAQDRYSDTIDLSTQHQTIDYFTASDCWSTQEIGGWSLANKQKLADLLFSPDIGIGLSAWRFNLGGGIELSTIKNPWRTSDTFEISSGKYDWTRCPNQRWFLAAAKARGVKTFIAFCNSPPRRLTVNGLTCMDDNPALTCNLAQGMDQQFAVYLADIVEHFRANAEEAERIDFNWVSPINEPQWDWVGGKQEGSRASDADVLRQYKAVAGELARRHLPTHILGPESGDLPDLYQPDAAASKKHAAKYGDYIDLLCDDGDMGPAMAHTIGYHSYWSEDASQLIEYRKKVRAKLDQHPQWRAAETEFCIMQPHRDLTMDAALRLMRVIHADLTIVNATAWSWWLAISSSDFKDGLLFTDWKKPGDVENIVPTKLFWAYGNFSRFVRPGMVRVEIKTGGLKHDIHSVFGSAYVDRSTRRVVAVYINSTDKPVILQLRAGTSVGRWTPYVTSDNAEDDLRPYPPFNGGEPFTLPRKSVVTLVSPD